MSVVLVGCGKKGGDAAKDGDAAKNGGELAPVELTWYFIGNGQQEDTALIEDEINKYIKDKINATVKLQCFDWGSYDEKIGTMIASREEFDICFTSSWANNYREKAVKGAFVPLNDMFDKYAPKTKELLGKDFLKGSEIGGVNYAIPTNKEKAHQWGFILREDLVKKYNMDISKIKKFEDIEPFLKTIKENEPGVYPLEAAGAQNPRMHLDYDGIDGENLGVLYNDSKDMKISNQFELPEMKEYLNTIHRFYNAGYIRKDAPTLTDYNADESAGKIFAAIKSLKPGKDKELTVSTGQPWVQVAITQPIIGNYDAAGSMEAISTTSKNPERALMFLELVNTDKYLNNLINYGVEGKHYVKVSDEVIKPGPENSKYNPCIQWALGNVFLNYLSEVEDKDKWDKFQKFNDAATPTKDLGFMFDPAPVKNEIAACKASGQDYILGLETGMLDPKVYLPKLTAAYKDAGIDKVIAEEQKQLDEWLSTQK
jgi:putative aldouronate transport system substrate-binding protein